MRKPRRLTPEELAPYQWQMPAAPKRGKETGDRGQETEHGFLSPVSCPRLRAGLAATLRQRQPGRDRGRHGEGALPPQLRLARPDTNFFGIEIVRKYQLYATTRFRHPRLPNVKTVR